MVDQKKSFSKKELEIAKRIPTRFGGEIKLFNAPVSYRENFIAHYVSREPWFMASVNECSGVNCPGYADNLSRPHGHDSVDCFGVPWKWVPTVGGSITPGGNPVFDDANDWRDCISMPDIDKWDWDSYAKEPVDTDLAVMFTFINGFWFERLISLMDFQNAAMALVDSDQEDALHELFGELTDLGIRLVDKFCEYWPQLDGFCVHDDWGSQKNPFFSEDVARRLFLPYMKEFVGHIHSKGRFVTIHSCGHVEDRIGIFVESGLDGWQLQDMNDTRKLYEEWGDKIVLEVNPEPFDVNDDKAAVQAAHDFVDFYCRPGKTAIMGRGGREATQSRVFCEELYEYSRKHFLTL